MTIEADLRDLAEALRARIPSLVSAIEQALSQEVPEIYAQDDPVLVEAERPDILSGLTSIVEGLAHGRRPPDRAAEAALEEVRVMVQAGIDLHSLLRSYRVGQSVLWRAIVEETLRIVDTDERRVAVLNQASDFHFAWNNKLTESVIAAYQVEHDAYFLRSQDQKRRVVVSEILRGVPADVEQLDYSLSAQHLAVIAWGRSPEANIRALAASFNAQHLTVRGTSGSFVSWLGSSTLESDLEKRPYAVVAMAGTRLALGRVAADTDGFRLSYREARQAYRVGRLVATEVVHYDDVALESLLLKDRQAVQDFVTRQLGPLRDDERSRDELLKTTLRVYFQSGLNAATTAQAINVHERTVAYRLRSIESRLGVSIAARRDELAVALRLADLIDGSTADDRRAFDYEDAGLGLEHDNTLP